MKLKSIMGCLEYLYNPSMRYFCFEYSFSHTKLPILYSVSKDFNFIFKCPVIQKFIELMIRAYEDGHIFSFRGVG